MGTEEKVIIFDTTLRDGEQSAGAGLTVDEKLLIALQLEKLGVNVIEAGFAASSPGDFQAVNKICKQIKNATVASLARVVPSDIESAARALEGVNAPRIHTFVSSSSIHMEHQMRKDPEEILEMAVTAVKKAKQYVDDVEFSPMDATRTDIEFLITLLEATIDAGASTINIPDTVGYGIPNEFGDLIKRISRNVSNLGSTIISVHCHNDLGLAVSNSLAAVENGARQIEGCINGLGERAGNASIEELVMGLETRKDYFGVRTTINTSEIGPTSRLVSNLFGFPLQANKAIVGQNAFRHSSGIHQDAYLKEKSTFEIMEPEHVGWRGEALVLGKLSGRAGLRSRLEVLGYDLNDEELLEIFSSFKILADQKKEITDLDLESLMAEHNRTTHQGNLFEIQSVEVQCGNVVQPKAIVKLKIPGGDDKQIESVGTGPVDAVCKAIDKIVDIPVNLTEYSVNAVTKGIDSLGEVTIRISDDLGQIFSGRGSDSDIVVSSAKAYVNAINRMIMIREEGSDSSGDKVNRW